MKSVLKFVSYHMQKYHTTITFSVGQGFLPFQTLIYFHFILSTLHNFFANFNKQPAKEQRAPKEKKRLPLKL